MSPVFIATCPHWQSLAVLEVPEELAQFVYVWSLWLLFSIGRQVWTREGVEISHAFPPVHVSPPLSHSARVVLDGSEHAEEQQAHLPEIRFPPPTHFDIFFGAASLPWPWFSTKQTSSTVILTGDPELGLAAVHLHSILDIAPDL
jgi:hypothetical protein